MKFILTILLAFSFISTSAYAVSHKEVYRADSAKPDVVFQRGFQPSGNNINLEYHVTGWSSSRYDAIVRNSAFISTTAYADLPATLIDDLLRPGEHYYLYHIRATDNFYSVPLSMRSIAEFQHADLSPELIEHMDEEEAYVSNGAIPPSQIERADIFYRDPTTNQITFQGQVANLGYVDADTRTNENPFTLSHNIPLHNRPVLLLEGTNISAAFEPNSTAAAWCVPAMVAALAQNRSLPQ
ncbi:Pertussis toxin subunit 1 [Commensalibacter sp. Nvir]|uniref:scabin-related ADP-ribosyltransferase n=1 Tax=Commensalibacter sp. Nvir TaxID=3069817 RepID=UPI002D673013|nr:Pertussis toxin subunit 1 [Commensalibacter sp. Nvir]